MSEDAADAEAQESAPAPESSSDQESKKLDEDATSSAEDEEEEEPTPQMVEALRILGDLVELQETTKSSWRAPQSASRSESPSSRP